MPRKPDKPEPLSVDDALRLVLAQCATPEPEPVPLATARRRYLAAPVPATLDLPPFANSAMDGYALRSADTPGRLRVIGESAAGVPFAGTLAEGQAVTISTGAAIPDGADAVVMIERVVRGPHRSAGDARATTEIIEVEAAVPAGDCIRLAGSDVRRGSEVLPAGIRIGAPQIGAAAALGLDALPCGRLPRVAVLATGSELRAPGEPLGPGQIYNSNAPMLAALLADAGAEVTVVASAADTVQAHRDALEQALEYDVALSTGGVSVGGHDLVREVGRELGVRELFWRVALKPGKPLSFGVRERSVAGSGAGPGGVGERAPAGARSPHTLVFGIPGNPVSVLVCFELFVRPALAALQGARTPGPHFVPAALATPVQANGWRDELIRVRLREDGLIEPLSGQGSHQVASSATAAGLARIPAGAGTLAAGTRVGFIALNAG